MSVETSPKLNLTKASTADLDLPTKYTPGLMLENHSKEGLLSLESLAQASKVIIQIGGNGGRLGEGVLTSAFIHPIHEVLTMSGKPETPFKLVIDQGLAPLYPAELYTQTLGRPVEVMPVMPVMSNYQVQGLFTSEPGNLVVFDFHGGNGRLPSVSHIEYANREKKREVTVYSDLFKPAVRGFAAFGPQTRYSRFIEHLFTLPEGSIDAEKAQPTILFDNQDYVKYGELKQRLELDDKSLTILCFFQSFVPAKCYGRWEEVLDAISRFVHQKAPNVNVNCVLACAPNGNTRDRYTIQDIESQFQDFSGEANNMRCTVTQLPLRDVAIVARHSHIALSNDTGPAHIVGAVGRPVIVPFIPGDILSKQVWSSAPSFRGTTIEPSPYTSEQLIEAIHNEDFSVIDSIDPNTLIQLAVDSLSS